MTVIALTASSGLNQTIDMIHDDHALQDPLLLAALLEGANGGGGGNGPGRYFKFLSESICLDC